MEAEDLVSFAHIKPVRVFAMDGGLVRDLLDSGELLRVLEPWSASSQDLYLLYPSRQYLPFRTKIFLDFVAERFAALPGFDRPLGRPTSA